MPLNMKSEDGESWYRAGLRYAKKYGLEGEYNDSYNYSKIKGKGEADAVNYALSEWDLLDYESKEL